MNIGTVVEGPTDRLVLRAVLDRLCPGDDRCAQGDYECIQTGRNRPGYWLTLKKYDRLLRRTDGRIKKPIRQYRRAIPQIADAWDTVRRICTQAELFTQDVRDHIRVIEDVKDVP